jgi:hypothetical protein
MERVDCQYCQDIGPCRYCERGKRVSREEMKKMRKARTLQRKTRTPVHY